MITIYVIQKDKNSCKQSSKILSSFQLFNKIFLFFLPSYKSCCKNCISALELFLFKSFSMEFSWGFLWLQKKTFPFRPTLEENECNNKTAIPTLLPTVTGVTHVLSRTGETDPQETPSKIKEPTLAPYLLQRNIKKKKLNSFFSYQRWRRNT